MPKNNDDIEINKIYIKNEKYHCQLCNFITRKKTDFNRHILTKKHIKKEENECQINENEEKYECEFCDKQYSDENSLWSHRKKCIINYHTVTNNYQRNEITNEPLGQTEIVVELLKQNQEIKDLILEERREFQRIISEQNEKMLVMAENMGSNHHNTNVNNNKFNLNVFLNEQCKDAMSLTDFINSMDLSVEDFIKTGELGFVQGISRVMVNRINNMDLCNRPFHCTDLKRETVYIKDDKKWEKDENKKNLRKAVKQVANRNKLMVNNWREETPDVDIMGSQNYENFFKYAEASLGGVGKEQDKLFEDKIMRNMLKEVHIDKNSILT
tara:strand:+ start:318 stop:1298 length:981 start_codon:yes stop_codon:yes gene_type:complete